MFFRKSITGISAAGMFLFFCVSAFGADAPSNAELLKELREMRKIIKKQDERITGLEKQLQEQSKAVEEQQSASDARKREMDLLHGKVAETQEALAVRQAAPADARKEELDRLRGITEAFQGLVINAGITAVGQGTPDANNAGGGEDSRFDGSYSVDVELEKQFDDYGLAFIHLEAGQGDTIEGDLAVFSNVNRDAGDSNAHVDVAEAWYEHFLFDRQVILTGGKIDATGFIDTNEYANDECSQFLGRMFRNSDAIDWPDNNALGGRIMLAPEALKALELDAVYMDEDGDWEEIFNKPFVGVQLNFMPARAFDYDEGMWGGNYRVYFWYNGADHTKWKDAERTKETNCGVGLSCDQMLTEVFGVFGRFGWQNPEVSTLEYDWSVGGQMTGQYWNREEDVVAVAVGQAIPGKEYGDAGNPHDNETHLEAYYAYKVNDHLTLSPDMQFIWDPNGVGSSADGDNDCIFVYGVRGQVDF